MSPLALEVIVSTVQDAVEAARGGAQRLEVVRALDRGGLTPAIDLVQQIQRSVSLPLRVMVRESDGFACVSGEECRALVDQAGAFNALGVDGIVVGWTRHDTIDEETLGRVLQAAPSLRATFHHAFDSLPDAEAALQLLARHAQIDHVLTHGGTGPWPSRGTTLARYVAWAAPRITIMPGGGVDEEALRALVECRCITEAHVGRAARTGRRVDGAVSAEAVRRLRRISSTRRSAR